MTATGDSPIRTCVGCRAKGAQATMLRFGRRADGMVEPALVTRDVRGRSAYLCPRRSCLDLALRRRAFTRAFAGGRGRVGVLDIDADALWTATAEQLRREIDLLGRTSENPHAHPRRRGLEQLLFELSSQPKPPERSPSRPQAQPDELTRKGGSPSHG